MKLIFNKHDGFYIAREEFIKQTNMEEKEQVGYLSNEYKFILILASLTKKEYHLIGCRSEDKAKSLLAAVVLANRYQELVAYSTTSKYPLNPYYLEFIINMCNNEDVVFVLRPSMLSNDKEELFVKHFLSKGEFIEMLQIEDFDMYRDEIEKLVVTIISIPQHQLKKLVIKDCKMNDDSLTDFARALRHNSYLRVLSLDHLSISDRSLKSFSSIWQYIPFLEEVHITRCKQIKGEQYFGGFLASITTSLNLNILDLSHNSFSEIIINTLAEEILSVKNLLIKTVDLSYNCFTPRENWIIYQLFLKSPVRDTTQLLLAPYPIHEAYFTQLSNGKRFTTVVFERVSLSTHEKRKILTNDDLVACKEICEEINQCVLFQKTIEDIHAVCKRIDSLDFDFPPQYIERLSELIRELVNSSFQAEDFYAFSICYDCSKILMMNKSEGRLKLNNMSSKCDLLTEELNRVLNFQFQELKINNMLNDIVVRAINTDARGQGVDLLYFIKELRDQFINTFINKGIDQNYIENEMMDSEPFFILESNDPLEERSKFLDDKTHANVIGSHPKLADYLRISEYQRSALVKEFVDFVPNTDIVNKMFYERLIFLLITPKETSFITRFKPDILLYFCKALVIYRWSLSKKSTAGLDLNSKIAVISLKKSKKHLVESEKLKQLDKFVNNEKYGQQQLKEKYKQQTDIAFISESDLTSMKHLFDGRTGIYCSCMQKREELFEGGLALFPLIHNLVKTYFFESQESYIVLLLHRRLG